jgi:hypothetical protein
MMLHHAVMRDIRGCYTSRAFKSWEQPLSAWFSLLDEYAHVYRNKDAGYWYNERATLSSFVGALWRAGAVALEEYRCSRHFGGQPVTGRADLWFLLDGREYVVEAKQSWPARPRTLLARAEVLFDSATAQLHADLDGGSSRVALLFVVPRLTRQPDDGEFAKEWIQAASQIKTDVRAWHFPTTTRTLKSQEVFMASPSAAWEACARSRSGTRRTARGRG